MGLLATRVRVEESEEQTLNWKTPNPEEEGFERQGLNKVQGFSDSDFVRFRESLDSCRLSCEIAKTAPVPI